MNIKSFKSKLWVFFVLFFTSGCACSQKKFTYRNIDIQHQQQYLINKEKADILKKEKFQKSVDITIYLPNGYSKKGDKDYTVYLQKGIDENTSIIMPNFPVMIHPDGLRLNSNSKILFLENSKLIMMPNSRESYNALLVDGVENIEIYYPKIEGDRYKHKGNKGEWGMGILIWHSKNVFIYNPLINNMWGDAIYIGNDKNIISENILIRNGYLDNNRRNGISIIAGRKVQISNCFISNTNGTSPEYGLDIEPNKNSDQIENITIDSLKTYNNKGGGILIALDNLPGIISSKINIEIYKHVDYFSTVGMELYIDRGYIQCSNKNIIGHISIKDSRYFYNVLAAIRNNESRNNGIYLNLSDIIITNKLKKIQTVDKMVFKNKMFIYK